MNKDRRKELQVISDSLSEEYETIQERLHDLEACRDEEQEYVDNMPEGLQNSERGERAQQAVSSMEDAIGTLESIQSDLQAAIDSIQEAVE